MRLWLRVLVPLSIGTFAYAQTTGSENRVIPGRLPQHEPITAKQRLHWFAKSSFGPASLTGGLFSAGFGTWWDRPHEYGPHWDGFADRYGMRFTGIVTSNAMEAGLGAIWGEDPRYPRDEGQPFKNRVGHVVKWTFLSQDREGRPMPAYARYIAITGNNFLSNAWREQSVADSEHAVARIGLGFVGRLASNTFKEFWPDVRNHFFPAHQPTAGTKPAGESH